MTQDTTLEVLIFGRSGVDIYPPHPGVGPEDVSSFGDGPRGRGRARGAAGFLGQRPIPDCRGWVVPVVITELATAVQESTEVLTVQGEFADAIKVAKAADGPIVIYVETVPLLDAPSPRSWSDVPVSSASTLGPTWPPSELD